MRTAAFLALQSAVSTWESPPHRPPRAAGFLISKLSWPYFGEARSPRLSTRLLRRRRAGGGHGRADAAALRAARVRAQADRSQQARRRGPRAARRDLRRLDRRGARGLDPRVLGPRRLAGRAQGGRLAKAADDRRDVPARHEGAHAGT